MLDYERRKKNLYRGGLIFFYLIIYLFLFCTFFLPRTIRGSNFTCIMCNKFICCLYLQERRLLLERLKNKLWKHLIALLNPDNIMSFYGWRCPSIIIPSQIQSFTVQLFVHLRIWENLFHVLLLSEIIYRKKKQIIFRDAKWP